MSKSEILEIYLQKGGQQEKRFFLCSQCPYRTDRRNNLKRHTSTMHEMTEAILECCNSHFVNKAALRQHARAIHRHGYACSICGRVFCRRALLLRHDAVHSGFKEFSCNLCAYATSHKSNLERHMKIHDLKYKSPVLKTKADNRKMNRLYFETSHSRPCVSPVREHNPILASLLSKPPKHSDSPPWSTSSFESSTIDSDERSAVWNTSGSFLPKSEADHCGYEEALCESSLFHHYRLQIDKQAHTDSENRKCQVEEYDRTKKDPGLRLRHAIDVILGVKDASSCDSALIPMNDVRDRLNLSTEPCVVTTAANHWSGGHVSCLLPAYDEGKERSNLVIYSQSNISSSHTTFDSGSESDRGSSLSKRPWEDLGVRNHVVIISSSPSEASPALPPVGEEETFYVPKKLRMSKRYQKA